MAGKIKTVVVVVQENRSFDHMLGWMKSLNPDIDGVTGAETNRGRRRPELQSRPLPRRLPAIYEQVYGTPFVDAQATPITPPGIPAPPMSGFAQQAEKEKPGMAETVMSGFRPDAVPVYRELAQEFARYFDLKILPGNDDHPSHDVSEGQRFVKEVYEALRSGPQWEETLLVITYDEHGGFYDHVPTPVGVPSPDGIISDAPFFFNFDRLGVRVPAFFISPWIEPGTVVHRPSGPHPTSEFEHSSIPATVKKIFNLGSFLTKRDAWAGTFDVVLTRDTPRTDCPATLPEPVKMRPTEAAEHATISDFQAELVQLGAALNGDHAKDTYPHKLVEGMTVADAARYCNGAFKAFQDECERCKKCGKDGSHIPTMPPSSPSPLPPSKKRSGFASKMLACFACGHSS
ncbi:Non-hemolytic phospholipase C [Triticum urartu]|uniref:Non-hemolytic phospholipase C n=1 Tax=Triticum urartu TaxID=4572 RepID=M7ZD56_TRIUA|nr:Non-hemolytic phospholipase C [Triticum urartu]